jgi:nucleotide-binding universal stress UspA family protein
MTHADTRPIVLGVDGGPGSVGALRYAVQEASRAGTELRLVHVSPSYLPMAPMMPSIPSEIARAGVEILDRARAEVSRLAPKLQVTTSRQVGSRVAGLVDSATHARLLVVGHETRVGLDRLLGGATTASVAAHARVPVVAVPADWTPEAEAGPIVVGLKTRAHAEELLVAAFERAAVTGAPIDVVHAWKLPDEYTDRIEERTESEYWLARGTELAEEVVAPFRDDYPDVAVRIGVVHDHPARALVHAAHGARLLVLVRRAPGALLGQHLGGTARAVLRAGTVPIEVVPGVEVVPETPGLELEQSGAMLR